MSARVDALVGVGLGLAAVLSGCPLPPAEACRAFVACQAAVDDSVETDEYDDGGSCWSLPDTARRCEARCRAALEALLDTPDPPEVCLDGAEAALVDST
jgi:hypothetical protein